MCIRDRRTPTEKIVRSASAGLASGFDLVVDPGEHNGQPLEVSDGSRLLERLLGLEAALETRRAAGPQPPEPGALPAGVHGALRASGYAGGEDEDL